MRDVDSVYSVWDWSKGRYNYYRAQRPRPVRARVGYPATGGAQGLGAIPEKSVHAVPVGAKYVGEGDIAIGTVASPKQRSGLAFVAAALAGLWWLG